MKTYLLIDEASRNYYIGRRTEEEVKPEVVEGLAIGGMREIGNGLLIQRET